ncbi:MAG: extracellular solute-binding protein [Candidatus Omnitrophica bacterium]|nr:extracellular solute-binding protein [Candidatus Omnitrophota bacterium]
MRKVKFAVIFLALLFSNSFAAEEKVKLKVWGIPNRESVDPDSKASVAIIDKFVELHPEIELETQRGVFIQGMGMDSLPLLAMAGGVAPDVMYVNFRMSDTYISEGFLYPLDEYVEEWKKEEDISEKIHPAIWPVIKRYGHIWSVPYGGTLAMALLYRKDLFQKAGLNPDKPPRDWNELYECAVRLTGPDEGTYGIALGTGLGMGWYFADFLWSAGGDIVVEDENGGWRAVYNDSAGVMALDFYRRLVRGRWKRNGKEYIGVGCLDVEYGTKWVTGKIGMMFQYLGNEVISTVNPNLTGVAPMPLGPTEKRGGEINSRMMGINATIKDKRIRDAAWKFIRFHVSDEALRIKTRIFVESGYAKFLSPDYLKKFGYERYLRDIPKGWAEALKMSLKTGKPEPYGKNCQHVYIEMTRPLERARIDDKTSSKELLDEAVKHTNEKMLGIIKPKEMRKRRMVALFVSIALAAAFAILTRIIIKSYSMPRAPGRGGKNKKYFYAYLILLPAIVSVLLWSYYPLIRGSFMAFQDYKLILPVKWIGLDNFANALFTPLFWQALLNSGFYMALFLGLGFLTPIILAIMLSEVPKGKILFRTIYYLPAVTTGLVIMFLWKGFFDPSPAGVFNKIMGFFGMAPQTWLNDPRLAMLCVVLPIVWATLGPGSIIYLAALKTIPEELYDAADIDGANIILKARYIVFPYLKPLIIINFVGAFIGAFRSFDFIFTMTGGGPNFATHVLGLEIWYNAFLYLKFGYAVAMAWLLGSLLLGFTVFQLRILSKLQFKTAGA